MQNTMYDRWIATCPPEHAFRRRPNLDVFVNPRGATVLLADDVARWMSQNDHEIDEAKANDLVCVPPPFDKTWVEYTNGIQGSAIRAFGVLVQAQDVEDHHVLSMDFFVEQEEDFILLGSGGMACTDAWKPLWEMKHWVPLIDDDPRTEPLTLGIAMIAMGAFQLMSMPSSNVPRRIIQPAVYHNTLWRKKHGLSLTEYHVIDVGPSREELRKAEALVRSERAAGRTAPSMHWVRGHFKRGQFATDEHPAGRYVRPHLRGILRQGAPLAARYNVRAPVTN